MRAFMTAVFFLIYSTLNPQAALAQNEVSEPPAYLFITGWYKDEDLKQAYYRGVSPILRPFGFEAAVPSHEGENLRVIEGGWIPGRILLARFSTKSHVKKFWWSKEYEKVKAIREPASVLDIALVSGVSGVTPLMNGKTAYLVFYADITDRDTFLNDYAPYAPKIVKKHGGQFLVSSTRAETELLEGTIPNATLTIIEFPTLDAMKAFWSDPEYRRLSEIRKATGKWSVAEIAPVPEE